jgi:hypothetical protein
MVVNCEQVWQKISNYLENELDPALRSAMEEHFRECKHCASVLQGTKNVIELYGDERLFQAPFGYSWRLRGKLAKNMPPRKGTAFGWLVAAAATGLIVGSVAIAGYANRGRPALLSEHAQPSQRIPNELAVLVAPHTKVFHVAGCTFIHDKDQGLRSMTAAQAEQEGYVPCVHCLGKYLVQVAIDFFRKHAPVTAAV